MYLLISALVKPTLMSLLKQMDEWSVKHHPKWLVVLRVVLGFLLFFKGFGFIENNVLLADVIARTEFIQQATWLTTIIPWIHLLGGSMIIIGLFTRLSCLVQIPIVLGAVLLVNVKQGLFAGGSDLPFSIIILLMLCFFFVEGGGPLSFDGYLRRSKESKANN